MGRINNKYPSELKIKVVKRYLEDEESLQDIADEFGISSKTQIHNWVKKYEELGEEAFKFEKRGNPKDKKELKNNFTFDNLEDEVIFLRMENEYLKRFCEMLKRSLRIKK
ncbi:helix-turn-helix domain-containing protein [Candidatus Cetobacterium colombiensis]|uniref:Helix-turn-helix domain-containing protein n=1 Tax=Candidatus Cetobacterium colombiensis TaxID=3073100 RepID=A0ABU4WBH9_9FUSO|nr:helix-turn-helix domain-containing protein [Candidatus Cetobacterium colombiensis]MDX8336574.1 helix-turn-helix domain-containing protein [Candidatus Cetobacterium colombiensis]